MKKDDFNFSDFLSGDMEELEFSIGDFNLEDLGEESERYIKPVFNSRPQRVSYQNAQELAKRIQLKKGEQLHTIVPGSFIFGDLIEALLTEKKRHCQELYASTLSISQENIDSFYNLMTKGWVGKLTLAVSNFFYSHERAFLVPYTLEKLDIDNRFDFLVFRNHTKIILMRVDDMFLVFTGSANLRSSNSIEQFSVQESEELYSFYLDFFNEKAIYSIIDKEKEKNGSRFTNKKGREKQIVKKDGNPGVKA